MLLRKTFITNNKHLYLATYSQTDSIIADQFRTIRTNIKFLTNKNKQNIILFTSPNDGEGKSITIGNLAVSMAQQNEKVLLIDANLKNSILHQVFNVPNENGLTNILKGTSTLFDAINQSDIKHLDILTSGVTAPNPSELLGSENMRYLLKAVASKYDVVLIDSPTVLKSTDTSVIANQCTGVVLVVNQDRTKIDNVVETKRVLDLADAKLIGVIVNKR